SFFLHQHGVTRLDVARAMEHGWGRGRRSDNAAAPEDAGEDPPFGRLPADHIALAPDLEASLNACLMNGRQARHEFLTVEHLLLALLDNPSAAAAIDTSAGDIEALRRKLQRFLADNMPIYPEGSEGDTLPTLGFQRVIRRAMLTAAPGTQFITGRDVLMVMFREVNSHAVY